MEGSVPKIASVKDEANGAKECFEELDHGHNAPVRTQMAEKRERVNCEDCKGCHTSEEEKVVSSIVNTDAVVNQIWSKRD